MLRTLFKSDVPQLLAIEEAVHVTPWTAETFAICFQAGYLGWVIEEQQKILGFIIVSMHTEECHVLNLCVAQAVQRRGLGHSLLDHALQMARQQGARIAYLEVRRSNLKAIALYQKTQFQLIGERKDYYQTVAGNEDALIFGKELA